MALELLAAALSKLRNREVPGSLAVVVDRELPERGRDGRSWTFCVTDGAQVAWVVAELLGGRGGASGRVIDPALLEAAVERRAINSYPVETRIGDLVSAGSVVLRAEDLKQHPNLPGFG